MIGDVDASQDLIIINSVLKGNVDAFEQLLKKYREHVMKIVKKHVPFEQIEETAHDVFIRAYKSLPTLKQKNSFKSWLSSIAVRTCNDFWRKQYRSRELPMSSLNEKQELYLKSMISNQLDQLYQQQEAKEILDWALQKLSPGDRMVVELVYLEGLTGKEAAQLLGITVANVKVRSFRAREKLEKLLKNFFKNWC